VKDEDDVILDLLVAHEQAIGQLYELYAGAFPGHRPLWTRLAADEWAHAERLATLRAGTLRNAWRSQGRWLRSQPIRLSIGFVEQQQAKVQAGEIVAREALATARDLESALLEKQFARLDDSLPAEVLSVLRYLAAETEQHRALVVAALEAETGAAGEG
jgi:hypothetical protein